MERLDKVLSNLGYGTRKEIKQVVKKGFVTVNDEKVKDSGLQIDPEERYNSYKWGKSRV